MEVMTWMIQMYMNAFRQWLVKKLLGRNLIVENKVTPDGLEWQLIDINRRIPYGWIRAEKENSKSYKLILPPSCSPKWIPEFLDLVSTVILSIAGWEFGKWLLLQL